MGLNFICEAKILFYSKRIIAVEETQSKAYLKFLLIIKIKNAANQMINSV